jgi:hypothetical protein
MNKLDVNSLVLAISHDSFPDLQPARRLIVLVPESGVDSTLVARKIWELANVLESRIQLLSLSKDAAHEPGLRRQLVILSALVGGDGISIDSKIELGNNWLNLVKSNWHEGDVIVCFSGQQSSVLSTPLYQALETNFNATVYVIGSFIQPEERRHAGWVSSLMAWVGSVAIIYGFFLLQAKLTQPPGDLMYTALLYVSIFIEFGSIWMWSSLFG